MQVNQLTDAQLMANADRIAEELLATSQTSHFFERLELTFDLLARELVSRGIWETA
mgnify:CR=1 FL=1